SALIQVSGAAEFVQRFDVLPLARGAIAAYARDLDGDGAPERILESQRVRASFSGVDGRWMEWVWKDSNTNLLPESGLWGGTSPATARPLGAGWEFLWNKDRRAISLAADNRLTIEQDAPLPAELLKPGKKDGVSYSIERPSPNHAVFYL